MNETSLVLVGIIIVGLMYASYLELTNGENLNPFKKIGYGLLVSLAILGPILIGLIFVNINNLMNSTETVSTGRLVTVIPEEHPDKEYSLRAEVKINKTTTNYIFKRVTKESGVINVLKVYWPNGGYSKFDIWTDNPGHGCYAGKYDIEETQTSCKDQDGQRFYIFAYGEGPTKETWLDE